MADGLAHAAHLLPPPSRRMMRSRDLLGRIDSTTTSAGAGHAVLEAHATAQALDCTLLRPSARLDAVHLRDLEARVRELREVAVVVSTRPLGLEVEAADGKNPRAKVAHDVADRRTSLGIGHRAHDAGRLSGRRRTPA